MPGNDDCRKLNEAGRDYKEKGKTSLALMCLVESLRINPSQTDILTLAESLSVRKNSVAVELKADTCLVSVIMPTYNRAKEISESVRSVLAQNFQDFELLVINDGGSDDVKNVIDTFNSKKIKYIRLKDNKGLSAALNAGALLAQGKYIAYLDDDDIYYPEHLEILVEYIERTKGCDCVYSNAWRCHGEAGDSGFVEQSRTLYAGRPDTFDLSLLREANYISTLNVLHRKSCFAKAGLFNEDMRCLMDWDLWIRLSERCSFHQINAITGEYRWKNNNMTILNAQEQEFLSSVLKNYYKFGQGKIGLLKAYIYTGRVEKAEELFAVISGDYPVRYDPRDFIEELFFAQFLFSNRDTRLFRLNLTKDYFSYNPRKCLSSLLKNGRLNLLLRLLPLVSVLIVKKLGRFTRRIN